MRLRVLVLLALAMLPGCGGEAGLSPGEVMALAEAEVRWADRGPVHYTLEVRRTCFCAPPSTDWAVIEVDHDTLVRVNLLATGDSVPRADWAIRPPVPGLFEEIKTYRSRLLQDVQADYDPATGYPTRMRFSAGGNVGDGNYHVEARHLVALP